MAPPVRHFAHLNGAFDDIDDSPKWVQVAREGEFLGYAGGEMPFRFSRQTFQQIVDNLHAHPAFQAGPDGVGVADVVPWDFNHASEQDPTLGGLPHTGAPAQGWTLDMQVRNGADGKAQLWALTRFIEPARSYVRNGQMQWASVAVTFNATDPVTGQEMGAVVTSIALTNTPFIEGMEKLVATKNGKRVQPDVEARRFFDAADGPEEVIRMMRDLFSLSETSGAAEVSAEVAKVAQWVVTGMAPLGVDVSDIVASMRTIFNLPALTTSAEVLAHASEMIPRLLEDQAVAQGEPAAPDAAVASRNGEDEMDELIKFLASKLGVRANEDAVKAEIDTLVALRAGMKAKLGADKDGNTVLLEAAEKTVNAREKLTALVKALGVEDADGAVERVASLMEQAKQLSEVMPELEGLKAKAEKAEEEQIEQDVAAAMASKGYGEEMKDMLLLYRKENPEGFAKKYPRGAKPSPATPAQHAVAQNPSLLSNLTAGPNGSVTLGKPPAPASAPQPALIGGDTVNLAMYPGRNATERAMAHLAATHAGWKNMTHDQQFIMACNFKKQPHVVDQAS